MQRTALLVFSLLAVTGFWLACSDGDDGYGPYPSNEFVCSQCDGGAPYEANTSPELCEYYAEEVNNCLEFQFSEGNCLGDEKPSCVLIDCEFEPELGWCGL